MADKNAIRANAKEETEAKGPKPGSGAAPDDNDLRRELKSEQVRDMRQTRRIRLERPAKCGASGVAFTNS